MQTPENDQPAAEHKIPHSKHLATASPFKGKTGIRRLINAFGYSLQGFSAAFKHEDAFRQEVLMALILIPLAFYLGASAVEQALMIASVLLVLIVELLNSAIEAAVDQGHLKLVFKIRHRPKPPENDIGAFASDIIHQEA